MPSPMRGNFLELLHSKNFAMTASFHVLHETGSSEMFSNELLQSSR